eukprot:tig00020725_g13528.t1
MDPATPHEAPTTPPASGGTGANGGNKRKSPSQALLDGPGPNSRQRLDMDTTAGNTLVGQAEHTNGSPRSLSFQGRALPFLPRPRAPAGNSGACLGDDELEDGFEAEGSPLAVAAGAPIPAAAQSEGDCEGHRQGPSGDLPSGAQPGSTENDANREGLIPVTGLGAAMALSVGRHSAPAAFPASGTLPESGIAGAHGNGNEQDAMGIEGIILPSGVHEAATAPTEPGRFIKIAEGLEFRSLDNVAYIPGSADVPQFVLFDPNILPREVVQNLRCQQSNCGKDSPPRSPFPLSHLIIYPTPLLWLHPERPPPFSPLWIPLHPSPPPPLPFPLPLPTPSPPPSPPLPRPAPPRRPAPRPPASLIDNALFYPCCRSHVFICSDLSCANCRSGKFTHDGSLRTAEMNGQKVFEIVCAHEKCASAGGPVIVLATASLEDENSVHFTLLRAYKLLSSCTFAYDFKQELGMYVKRPSNRGCPQKFPPGSDEHIKHVLFGCEFRPEECQHCKKMVMVKDMISHLMECEKCGAKYCLGTEELQKHEGVCPKKVVKCPNVDGSLQCSAEYERCMKDDHNKVCEYWEVDCAVPGCGEKMLRHKLPGHNEEKEVHHLRLELELNKAKTADLQAKYSALEAKNSALEADAAAAIAKTAFVEAVVEQTSKQVGALEALGGLATKAALEAAKEEMTQKVLHKNADLDLVKENFNSFKATTETRLGGLETSVRQLQEAGHEENSWDAANVAASPAKKLRSDTRKATVAKEASKGASPSPQQLLRESACAAAPIDLDVETPRRTATPASDVPLSSSRSRRSAERKLCRSPDAEPSVAGARDRAAAIDIAQADNVCNAKKLQLAQAVSRVKKALRDRSGEHDRREVFVGFDRIFDRILEEVLKFLPVSHLAPAVIRFLDTVYRLMYGRGLALVEGSTEGDESETSAELESEESWVFVSRDPSSSVRVRQDMAVVNAVLHAEWAAAAPERALRLLDKAFEIALAAAVPEEGPKRRKKKPTKAKRETRKRLEHKGYKAISLLYRAFFEQRWAAFLATRERWAANLKSMGVTEEQRDNARLYVEKAQASIEQEGEGSAPSDSSPAPALPGREGASSSPAAAAAARRQRRLRRARRCHREAPGACAAAPPLGRLLEPLPRPGPARAPGSALGAAQAQVPDRMNGKPQLQRGRADRQLETAPLSPNSTQPARPFQLG